MGDLNAAEDNPVIAYLNGTEDLRGNSPVTAVDTFRVIHPDEKTVGTFNGFEGRADESKIDYIFVSPGFHTLDADIVRTHRKGRYPSDHFPVTAHIRFE